MHPRHTLHLLLGLLLSFVNTLTAQVPGLINYQGRVAVGGVNFDGAGQFKFALVNADGSLTHWSNDGTYTGEPAAAVAIPVVKGLYSVLLGDTSLANMQSISSFVFQSEDVRLRVWFNDGTHGFQQLTPDQRIAAAGYAMMAASVPDGSITQFKLAPGAVTGNAIQPFSINSNHLQNGAVSADKIAAGAVMRDAIADGAVNGTKISAGAVGAQQIAAAAIGGESWIPTSAPQDGPVGRLGHSVVWTGEEFLIWGGVADVFGGPAVSNTGARYNPSTDTWTNITLTGAPAARRGHTAVWTGTHMVIWGGTTAQDGESGGLNSGGRYNPATDSWTNTGGGIGVPLGRRNHTAVWTGTDMIIWGGQDADSHFLGDGSKLDGSTNIWTSIATDDAPNVRHSHSAIWTGSKMVIWGGIGVTGPTNTGNVYDSDFNIWATTPMPLAGAPDGRSGQSVVWSGTDMLVWGGEGATAQPVSGGTSFQRSNGARYRVETNSWQPITTTGAPAHRADHTAVWTGHEMLVWGGRFATDLGGSNSVAGSLDNGATYLPDTDSWRPVVQSGAPSARTDHVAAWTGREMVVWGGNGLGTLLNTGGRYRLSLIANGAVGARQLADEAVHGNHITAGAVGSAQLSNMSVTASHLRLGVENGQQAEGALSLTADGFYELSSSFQQQFTTTPSLFLSNGWDLAASSPGGFVARKAGSFAAQLIGTSTNSLTGAAALIADGFPAALYFDATSGNISYVYAGDQAGTSWSSPEVIASGATSAGSVVNVNGRPAVAFATASGLYYMRALSAKGDIWQTPLLINADSITGTPSLAVVDGKPSVAYAADTFGKVKFAQATDVDGTSWSSATTVRSATGGTEIGFSTKLIEAAGRPAIGYVWNTFASGTQKIVYLRADNAAGNAWTGSATEFELGLYGTGFGTSKPKRHIDMTIVAGNPAVVSFSRVTGGSHLNEDKLEYWRSSTPEGSDWNEPLPPWTIGQAGSVSLRMIGGHPAIAFKDLAENLIQYTRAGTVQGTSSADFFKPIPVLVSTAINASANIVDVAGLPGVVTTTGTAVVFSTLDASIASPALQWQASDGTIAPLIATNVQTGAIGTTQLANGAVETANIAGGAVGTAQLAAGSVTNAQLAKPPQAGSIDQGQIELQFGQASFEVSFPQPYAAPPIVTVSLNSSDPALAGSSIIVESTTTNGFTGRIQTAFGSPVTLAEGSEISFALTDDYLIFATPGTLQSKFVYSYSENAPSQSTMIDSNAHFLYPSAIMIPGAGAAIAYYDYTNQDLKFAHEFYAAAGSGLWETPIIIESAGDVGANPSLGLVLGQPAIAYYDKTNQVLKYRISSDFGNSWSPPVVVAVAGDQGVDCTLLEVNGYPAIAYYRRDDDTLRFVRASDSVGSVWSTAVVVDDVGDPGSNCSLAMVNGRPAISCYVGVDQSIGYYRASNSSGSAWDVRVTAANAGTYSGSTSLHLIEGKPAIAFHAYQSTTPHSVQFVRSSNVDGLLWNTPVALKTAWNCGFGMKMVVKSNEVGITYYNSLNRRIESFGHSLTPASFSANWIALPQ